MPEKSVEVKYAVMTAFACTWEMYKKIEEWVKRLGTTRSAFVREAVREYLERLERPNGGDR